MTPTEFLNSEYLQRLKEKFLNGEYDDTCSGCKRLETAGLQSIRKYMLALYGDSVVDINNADPVLDYMELRTSNLCNFQCKMCNAQSSSLIAGKVIDITENNFEEILKLSSNLKHLVLTGGEPMLIKHYYELLDHLAEFGRPELIIRIYTNASVYNPVFVEKMLKFNTALRLSIDAVGKTAEIQREGTNWKVVSENVNKFLKLPIEVQFHTTLTTIALADVHSLAKYFVDIAAEHQACTFKAHTAGKPDDISVFNTPLSDIPKIMESIDKALDLLLDPRFEQLRNQLASCRNVISKKLELKR
jgi:sulfatase maturation enzyme AslB (radical SAM superfamily)